MHVYTIRESVDRCLLCLLMWYAYRSRCESSPFADVCVAHTHYPCCPSTYTSTYIPYTSFIFFLLLLFFFVSITFGMFLLLFRLSYAASLVFFSYGDDDDRQTEKPDSNSCTHTTQRAYPNLKKTAGDFYNAIPLAFCIARACVCVCVCVWSTRTAYAAMCEMKRIYR